MKQQKVLFFQHKLQLNLKMGQQVCKKCPNCPLKWFNVWTMWDKSPAGGSVMSVLACATS